VFCVCVFWNKRTNDWQGAVGGQALSIDVYFCLQDSEEHGIGVGERCDGLQQRLCWQPDCAFLQVKFPFWVFTWLRRHFHHKSMEGIIDSIFVSFVQLNFYIGQFYLFTCLRMHFHHKSMEGILIQFLFLLPNLFFMLDNFICLIIGWGIFMFPLHFADGWGPLRRCCTTQLCVERCTTW
jgi:hypothetical protein